MGAFLRKVDLTKRTDERLFVLPPKYHPDKVMLHSMHQPDTLEVTQICRVMPNGEVFKFDGARLEDIAIVLLRHYGVSFKELADIWYLDDLYDG